jgi:hypothetical protein
MTLSPSLKTGFWVTLGVFAAIILIGLISGLFK